MCSCSLVFCFISFVNFIYWRLTPKKSKKKICEHHLLYSKIYQITTHDTHRIYTYLYNQFSSCCFSIVRSSMFLICMMMISSFVWCFCNGMLVRHTTLSRALAVVVVSAWTVHMCNVRKVYMTWQHMNRSMNVRVCVYVEAFFQRTRYKKPSIRDLIIAETYCKCIVLFPRSWYLCSSILLFQILSACFTFDYHHHHQKCPISIYTWRSCIRNDTSSHWRI